MGSCCPSLWHSRFQRCTLSGERFDFVRWVPPVLGCFSHRGCTLWDPVSVGDLFLLAITCVCRLHWSARRGSRGRGCLFYMLHSFSPFLEPPIAFFTLCPVLEKGVGKGSAAGRSSQAAKAAAWRLSRGYRGPQGGEARLTSWQSFV